jgi:hypothetical protein
MPTTYEPIATTTLGSAQATVTFSSISGSYTDLVLVISCNVSSGSQDVQVRYNSDSASNYSTTNLYGTGSIAGSNRQSNSTNAWIGLANTTNRGVIVTNFQNYSNSTTNKTAVSRSSVADYEVDAMVSLWRSTSAITSIEIKLSASTFTSGSTFTLYGIKAA